MNGSKYHQSSLLLLHIQRDPEAEFAVRGLWRLGLLHSIAETKTSVVHR